ncbi:hypothetical protein K437DRAFT_255973 [Tilletiaria anomala UBC 951]|uniref:Uncharacterized protein n=1 Tax=Tilletiaria anomala (strain ATCC 24038 / CBS 436.72 / UBC 951) TaxID=1037660 RepID=A0A066VZL7_TILAU|nr:uncharacterized protein K437DRAFT_255973 [Tilletiaria anomala UBC 951]KDN47177.1 hypothetical protein K437DRAFT_255973 [Tilletiaria anomala UBC 951]
MPFRGPGLEVSSLSVSSAAFVSHSNPPVLEAGYADSTQPSRPARRILLRLLQCAVGLGALETIVPLAHFAAFRAVPCSAERAVDCLVWYPPLLHVMEMIAA